MCFGDMRVSPEPLGRGMCRPGELKASPPYQEIPFVAVGRHRQGSVIRECHQSTGRTCSVATPLLRDASFAVVGPHRQDLVTRSSVTRAAEEGRRGGGGGGGTQDAAAMTIVKVEISAEGYVGCLHHIVLYI